MAITDGLSNTLLVGEKHVRPTQFGKGDFDNSIYNGDLHETVGRYAGPPAPLINSPTAMGFINFGSSHPGVCNFVLCDGSVRSLQTSISTTTLGSLAGRNDGLVVGDY